jgi:hypothetical protein
VAEGEGFELEANRRRKLMRTPVNGNTENVDFGNAVMREGNLLGTLIVVTDSHLVSYAISFVQR